MCMTIVASSSSSPSSSSSSSLSSLIFCLLIFTFAHPASYATPEGFILSTKKDVNVDFIIIPARVHPNNGPVTIIIRTCY